MGIKAVLKIWKSEPRAITSIYDLLCANTSPSAPKSLKSGSENKYKSIVHKRLAIVNNCIVPPIKNFALSLFFSAFSIAETHSG